MKVRAEGNLVRGFAPLKGESVEVLRFDGDVVCHGQLHAAADKDLTLIGRTQIDAVAPSGINQDIIGHHQPGAPENLPVAAVAYVRVSFGKAMRGDFRTQEVEVELRIDAGSDSRADLGASQSNPGC